MKLENRRIYQSPTAKDRAYTYKKSYRKIWDEYTSVSKENFTEENGCQHRQQFHIDEDQNFIQ